MVTPLILFYEILAEEVGADGQYLYILWLVFFKCRL